MPSFSLKLPCLRSVFPAEACDTLGGEACDAEMYPEVKLKPETSNKAKTAQESEDRLSRVQQSQDVRS
ncbi:hypothetical protein RJ639_003841 [Escallonia herrerae]|uniref:Uncharacterized protein n=1 Tax=Escallonia herrerae TaxID=1293975 RepID=A0AA88VZ56_9ASTE|nr:hypothetical protein RJ639_003841 [Escallonia herrerae]